MKRLYFMTAIVMILVAFNLSCEKAPMEPQSLEMGIKENTIPLIKEGCTPGYWKNHTESWVGYDPQQQVQEVFNDSRIDDYYGLENATLLEALKFGGGRGKEGALRIMLRAAVASLLNSANPDVGYSVDPQFETVLKYKVSLCFRFWSREQILEFAAMLDGWNNQFCPLN